MGRAQSRNSRWPTPPDRGRRGATTTTRLTGWKAIVAIVAFGGLVVFRTATARARLDTTSRAALETRIRLDVIRPLLADSSASLAERGAAVLKASTVHIRSIRARGPLNDAVVRVEFEPGPALPPGTPATLYYHMRYTTLTGWTLYGRTSKLRWYLAAF